MKKLITAIFTLFIIGSAPVESYSQGFLKKINKKLEQTNQKLKEIGISSTPATKTTNQASSEEVYNGYETETTQENPDIYPDLKRGKVIRDYDNHSFAETPSTIIINTLNDIVLSDFHDGMALVREGNDNYYFISSTGEKCTTNFKIRNSSLSSGVDNWPRFSNGRALIYTGKEWIIIDKKGNIVKNLPSDVTGAVGFCDGTALICQGVNNHESSKYVFIDVNGATKYPALSFTIEGRINRITHMQPLRKSEGLTAVYRYDPAKKALRWGFSNENGTYAVSPKYYKVKDFHDGLAAVQAVETDGSYETGGKWGFIDKTGKQVIDFIFTYEPSDFSNGYALVENRERKHVVINKQGDVTMRIPDGWSMSNFCSGHAILEGSEPKGDGFDRRISYAVTDGGTKKVAYDVGEYIRDIKILNGEAYYSIGMGDLCLIDIPNMTTSVRGLTRPFSEDLAATADGYVNRDGEYVIRFKRGEF